VRARSGKGRSLPENGRCHTGSARPVGAASCRSAAVDGAVLRELAAHDEKRNQRRVSGLLIRRKLRPPRADWLRHMVRPLPHLMVVSLLWSIWAPFLPMQCNASGQVAAPWPTKKCLFSPPDLSRVLMTLLWAVTGFILYYQLAGSTRCCAAANMHPDLRSPRCLPTWTRR
jgi:hypothetical protein